MAKKEIKGLGAGEKAEIPGVKKPGNVGADSDKKSSEKSVNQPEKK